MTKIQSKDYYDLIFITTAINREYFERLLESISHNKSIQCYIAVVLQNGLEIPKIDYSNDKLDVRYITIPNQVNSSEGRNLGIEYIIHNKIYGKYVMFPDDDSTFDDNFFNNFNYELDGISSYIIPAYCEDTKILYKSCHSGIKNGTLIKRNFALNIGTINLILNYETFRRVGLFDELMGVGAKHGAGEDSDYFLRALKYCTFYFNSNLYTFHPSPSKTYNKLSLSKLISRYKKYGDGVIYMLCKHQMYYSAITCIAKGFGGSVIAILKLQGRLSIARLYAAFIRLCSFIRYINL